MGRVCEMCPENTAKPATVFCAADACFLCQACDVIVHSANRLARRHVRRAIGQSEMADGSSIDDNSETALVPDVSTLTCPDIPSAHVDEPLPSEDALLTALPQEGPVSFEDTVEYDFCDFVDDGLGAKMPALCAIDDDNIFSDNKGLGRSLYGEMSWESVVPEHIEHVVPDVSELSVSVKTGVPAVTREPKGSDMCITRKVLSAPSAASFVQKTGKSKVRIAAIPVARSNAAVTAERNGDAKKEATTSSTTKGNSTVGKRRTRDEEGETASSDHTTVEKPADSVSEIDGVAKGAEQRKKRRAEALARFRSKRANRSFTKKVRYECRKQLADSRPRVKGRFVRKIEMALFRKYGALYRDHLDELEPVPATLSGKIANESTNSIEDQRVPAL